MTTSSHRRDILASIADTRRVISQAEMEGTVQRGERNDWRADALERAGELALEGRWAESRQHAAAARER